MADLVIEQCLPSDRAAEIQDLFRRVGQPEFASVYQRVYTVRQEQGLRSWIAWSDDRVALHISVSLERFGDGTRTITGGLLGDLMADEGQRDFWSPIKLARRMVTDVKKLRTADFLLTSFLPAAEGVFRATGFKAFGEVKRFVLPLNWPYPILRRLMHGERRPRLTTAPFDDPAALTAVSTLRSPGCFRAVPSAAYYTTRMPRTEYPAGTWLLSGNASAPDAAVLVSAKPGREAMIVDVLWRDPEPKLAGLLSAAARWAARSGYRRLSCTTMKESRLARAVQRAGFILRPDDYPLMILSLGAAGRVPPHPDWSFTPFVLTAW